jgi:hypothetical protein
LFYTHQERTAVRGIILPPRSDIGVVIIKDVVDDAIDLKAVLSVGKPYVVGDIVLHASHQVELVADEPSVANVVKIVIKIYAVLEGV